ncbi:MAG: hypothetical protein ACYC9O_15550, partial [Candidatus Latescibacterota bacterium]
TDLDRRINSQIRRGYYGIGAVAALLALGIAFAAWWVRKRRKGIAAPDFLAEVTSMLESREEEADEFSLDDEELAERGRRIRVSEGSEEVEDKAEGRRQKAEGVEQSIKPSQPEEDTNRWDYSGRENLFRGKSSESGAESGRQPITEDIKTLVVRLNREGRSTVDIARLSDLTRTEVDLILAVRARDMEEMVETVREEQESETSAIHRAVGELAAEGWGATDIARRLGISTSEVNLALEVIKNWKKGRKK